MTDVSNRQDAYTTARPAKQQLTDTPAFQFSVLTCKRRILATKIIYADGTVRGYDKAAKFQFKYCEITSLEDFEKLVLTWLTDEPRRFIIRGQLLPGLDPELWHYRRILDHYNKETKIIEFRSIECPPRRWIPLDLDGVEVPDGYGAPDKLAEAAYFIRDNKLPEYFRGVRCVAAATSSTGRKGPGIAHFRLFFVLTRPEDNDALYYWAEGLSIARSDLRLDPAVLRAMQPIYTARPIFKGDTDPVPAWSRVRLLDGYADEVELELPRARERKKREPKTFGKVVDMPEWMLEPAQKCAGWGVYMGDEEPSLKAWDAIRRVFYMLDGCPKGNDKGRHKTLTAAAWEMANLVAEGELPEKLAREAYLEAAEGINNGDGKYDAAAIQRRIDDAFRDVGRVS
jgi:hypothetical protein